MPDNEELVAQDALLIDDEDAPIKGEGTGKFTDLPNEEADNGVA